MKVEPSVAGVADEPRAVLLIYTGGTIGMARSPRGYAPVPGLLAELLRARPDFQDRDRPPGVTPPTRHGRRIRYDILEYAPLVDSSNMGMGDWAQIARDIGRRYDAYDAFVVLHGTDTMAYTASALSFMLANLGKSVIVTGSMIPLTEVRSDGADNLLSALILAGHYELPEVGLYFHRQLLRGNRTRKVDAAGLGAFASANFPPLATVGVDIEVAWERVRAASGEPLEVRPITNENVAVLRLFPGISRRVLENFLAPPVEGVVLETYGSGNAPDNRADFLAALRSASDRGVVLVNTTQCARGRVATSYAAGTALAEAGVIGGADMTTEAALTKLAYLLSRGLSTARVRELIQTDLRGEMTATDATARFSSHERRFVSAVTRTLAAATDERGQVDPALSSVLLHSAATIGDLEAVRRLLDGGAGVDLRDHGGRTALHVAAAAGRRELVALLLDAGADPRACDPRGETPLLAAIVAGHDDVAQALRERGAAPSAETLAAALARAAQAGDAPTVRRLLAHGGAPSACDRDGRTPLHMSAGAGHLEVVDALLSAGADPRARDRWGETAADEARRGGHEAVRARLAAAITAP